MSLDIFWLKDESLEDSAGLPDPDVIAAEDRRRLASYHEQIATPLAKTSQAEKDGQWELYKTSHNFDGTYHNRNWLG